MGTEEEKVKRSAYVIGGPLHGKFVTEALTPILVVAHGPDQDSYYFLRQYRGGGWRVAIPMWVHGSLLPDSSLYGQAKVPMHLMPCYLRQASEVCPLMPRVRK